MYELIAIGLLFVLCGIVLYWRARHDARFLSRHGSDRGAMDEREAASRLRVRTGSVEASPRTPPVERWETAE